MGRSRPKLINVESASLPTIATDGNTVGVVVVVVDTTGKHYVLNFPFDLAEEILKGTDER